MKKTFLLLVASFMLLSVVFSQNDIPNSGFEDWSGGEPVNWNTLDQNILGTDFDMVTEDNGDSYSGTASVRLETISEYIFLYGDVEMPGLLTLGELEVDVINQDGNVYGGTPYATNPQSLSGYYKYSPADGDSAAIGVVLYRWTGSTRDTLAGGDFWAWEEVNEWTEFEAVLEYQIWATPDTMNIIISSTAVEAEEVPIGSVLKIDELSFNYGPTSIIDPRFSDDFRVYPDIYNHRFRIELKLDKPERATIQMFDINGNVILQKEKTFFNNSASISYRNVSSGIYIVRVITASGKAHTQKVRLY